MLPDAAVAFRRRQLARTAATLAATRRAWARMGPEFDTSWVTVGRELTVLVAASQLGAARNGAAYVPRVLAETGLRDDPAGEVDARSFAGVTSDGRELGSLLYGAVTAAKDATRGTIFTEDNVTRYYPGAGAQEALARGGRWLDMAVWTQIADAARGATSVGMAARPHVTGYYRMLNPPSCSRCAVLAGRHYRWNQGFARHPRCDCTHIPVAGADDSLRFDPNAYFRSLSESDQNRVFTNAGAQALRDGADMGRVVNARRGMSDNGLATTEATTRRRTRLTPQGIYDLYPDREQAIEQLRRHGYLLS